MNSKLLICALAGVALGLSAVNAASVSLTVPGTSNIWLAGQPNGTTLLGDAAPTQSPVNAGVSFLSGSVVTFSASGSVGYPGEPTGPDGASAGSHGANFGLSGITSNWNALLGVFVTDDIPGGVAPASLNFGTGVGQLTRDFTTLSPLLSQVFFVGNGQTSGATVQQFAVPSGATRLFLGTLDGSGWFNNTGSFLVDLTYTPPTSTSSVPDTGNSLLLLLLGVGSVVLSSAAATRRSRRQCA